MTAIQASGHVPADLPVELQALFPPYGGPFLQRLLSFDPAQALLGLDLPCLLLQGAADRQIVPMEDVQPLIDALAKRSAPGEAVIVPGVSHNLKLDVLADRPGLRRPAGACRRGQAGRLAGADAGRLIAPRCGPIIAAETEETT